MAKYVNLDDREVVYCGSDGDYEKYNIPYDMPIADVVERKKGKWVLDENPHDGDCRCSACYIAIDAMHERNHELLNALTGGKWWTFYKFCPNCGAEMCERREDAEIHS